MLRRSVRCKTSFQSTPGFGRCSLWQYNHEGACDGPSKRRAHVLLRVPNVTLGAEIGGAEIGPDNLRDNGFNDFEKTAQRRQCGHRQPCPPLFTRMHGAYQQFAHWIKQEEAKTEMNDAVVMIPV